MSDFNKNGFRLIGHGDHPCKDRVVVSKILTLPKGTQLGLADLNGSSKRAGKHHKDRALKCDGDRNNELTGEHNEETAPTAEEKHAKISSESAVNGEEIVPDVVIGMNSAMSRRPSSHGNLYKACAFGSAFGVLFLLPLGLSLFAYYRRHRTAKASRKLGHFEVTGDTDNLIANVEGGVACEEMFPAQGSHMGTSRARDSQVFCLFNASAHSRPLAYRFPLGMIPGALCNHVLYSSMSVTANGDLQSRAEEFDYTCKGLESTTTLKKRFQALKVHLVISAESLLENARLLAISRSHALRMRLINGLMTWAHRYGFDGIFVSWSDPFDAGSSGVFFKTLGLTLRPKLTLGVILPTSRDALDHYDLPKMALAVDWMIATTHGFYPNGDWSHTSCPSPYKTTDPNKQSVETQVEYIAKKSEGALNFTTLCFTISPRASGYRVRVPGTTIGMPALGPGLLGDRPGLLEDGLRVPGMLAYSQVCNVQRSASEDPLGLCVFTRIGRTWVAFENLKSMEQKVNRTLWLLKSLRGRSVGTSRFCLGVWDLDLDDHQPVCGNGPFPLVEMAVAKLP